MLTQETKLESSNRLLTSSLVSLSNEERDLINRIQQLAETRSQLTSSFDALKDALTEGEQQMEQLRKELIAPGHVLSEEQLQQAKEAFQQMEFQRQEMHRQYETLQLEEIQNTNRIHFIRKELVLVLSSLHSSLIWMKLPPKCV